MNDHPEITTGLSVAEKQWPWLEWIVIKRWWIIGVIGILLLLFEIGEDLNLLREIVYHV